MPSNKKMSVGRCPTLRVDHAVPRSVGGRRAPNMYAHTVHDPTSITLTSSIYQQVDTLLMARCQKLFTTCCEKRLGYFVKSIKA